MTPITCCATISPPSHICTIRYWSVWKVSIWAFKQTCKYSYLWRPFFHFANGTALVPPIISTRSKFFSHHDVGATSTYFPLRLLSTLCTMLVFHIVGFFYNMMTEKIWLGQNDRRHYSCSICGMEKWLPYKWPQLLAVQWLAHHHMYVLSDTGQYGKFQVEHSNKLANMVTSGIQFCRSLLELVQAEM